MARCGVLKRRFLAASLIDCFVSSVSKPSLDFTAVVSPRAYSGTGKWPLRITPVADLEARESYGEAISWHQVGFPDVLTVDERTVARIKVPNYQDAANLAEFAMHPTNPVVIQTDIGIRVSTEDRW
jgi:hypothetical protein